MKWQPQVFEDLERVHPLAVRSLRRTVAQSFSVVDRLNLYLIVGPEGSGKSTLARVLAQELGLNPHWYRLEWLLGAGQSLPLPDTAQDAMIFDDIDDFGRFNLAKVSKQIEEARLSGTRGSLIMTADLPGSMPRSIGLASCLVKMCDTVIELPQLPTLSVRSALQAQIKRVAVSVNPSALDYMAKHAYRNLNAAIKLLEASVAQSQLQRRRITKPLVRQVFAEEAINCHGLDDLGVRLMQTVHQHRGVVVQSALTAAMEWPAELCGLVVESLVASNDLVVVGDQVRRVTPHGGPPPIRIKSAEDEPGG